jgi:hypothetical protein
MEMEETIMLKNKNHDTPEKVYEQTKKLDLDDLDQVNGAGDPFAEEPRVPENPIDPDLRQDG